MKNKIYRLYLYDPSTDQRWEHTRSPWNAKKDGNPTAIIENVARAWRKKYKKLGYVVEMVGEKL